MNAKKLSNLSDRQLLEFILTNQVIAERKLNKIDLFLHEFFKKEFLNENFEKENSEGEKKSYETINTSHYRTYTENFQKLFKDHTDIKAQIDDYLKSI